MKINIALFSFLLLPLSVIATELHKSDWINSMSTALPAAFCNSGNYFRLCFKVTAQECEETSASATRVCLSKYKDEILGILIQPKDGNHWGSIIGNCVGIAYEATMKNQHYNTPKCNDAKDWQ